MITRLTMAVGAAAACLMYGAALAQITDPNKDEAKCETAAGKAGVKQTATRSKCVSKCIVTARKTLGPYAGCFSPYTDPATNACIFDPLKGADAKARAAIVKACAVDCPECYAPSVCATGEPFVTDTATQTNPFGGLIYCYEAAAGTPTTAEGKCELATGKALTKFVAAKSKCYAKCNTGILKGQLPQGACDPPFPADPATFLCIFDPFKGAEAKAAVAIDKVCEVSVNPANAKPFCYGTLTGWSWVGIAEGQIDFRVPIIACGSPSGAFLD